jgi:hypothetical protein
VTILEACTEVLRKAKHPLTAEEICREIRRLGLYEFKAKDPPSIVRGTLRRHLRTPQAHRIRQVDPRRFVGEG